MVIEDSVSSSTKKITRGDFLSGSALPNDTVTTASIDDNAVTTVKIADDAVTPDKLSASLWGYEVLADVTLGSAGDTLSSGTFTAKRALKVYIHVIDSGALSLGLRLNNDSGSNYAYGYISTAGSGSAVTQTAVTAVAGTGNVTSTLEIPSNLAAKQKLGFWNNVLAGASAATAPVNYDFKFVWNNTSAQTTRIDIVNSGAGDIAIGSKMIVLGRDW